MHPDWRSQGYEYYRAIWVECAELLDHFGWKWWKQQPTDVDQVQLEIVDIWHFGLSDLLRDDALDAATIERFARANDRSVVLRVTYSGRRVLLTGDAEAGREDLERYREIAKLQDRVDHLTQASRLAGSNEVNLERVRNALPVPESVAWLGEEVAA